MNLSSTESARAFVARNVPNEQESVIPLVRSRALVERFGGIGSRWSRLLPLASAVIVTALGLVIVFSGLVNFLG